MRLHLHRIGQLRTVVMSLMVVVVAPLAGWGLLTSDPQAGSDIDHLIHVVRVRDFHHVITEKGEVESSKNNDIRCRVHSQSGIGTAILSIIDEGTHVKKGDELVRFDSSALATERQKQQIACNASAAKVTKGESELKKAVITKREYEQGIYFQDERTNESDVLLKEQALDQAKKRLEYSERLALKGFVPNVEVESDKLTVRKADSELELANIKLRVLRDFTREKKLMEFQTEIDGARAELESERSTHQLDLDKLKLIESQIENCTVTSPVKGQVVYPEPFWNGDSRVQVGVGVVIREGQLVLRLPDFENMQVNAKVHESKIQNVKKGMKSTIRLEALPDLNKLTGQVIKVNEYPEETGFWKASKEYTVTIQLLDPPHTLRPGMTSEVKIHVETTSQVLTVPVQSVLLRNNKHYCARKRESAWRVQEVHVGKSNEKFAIIERGLEENDEVILNVADSAEALGFPAESVDSD